MISKSINQYNCFILSKCFYFTALIQLFPRVQLSTLLKISYVLLTVQRLSGERTLCIPGRDTVWMGKKTFGQVRAVINNVFVKFRHNTNTGNGNSFIFVSILVENARIEDLVQKLKHINIRLEHLHRKVGYMYAQNQSFFTCLDSKPV